MPEKKHKAAPINQNAIDNLFGTKKRDSLFPNGGKQDDKFTSKHVNKCTSKHVYKRATYHLLPEQIEAIKIIAFFEDTEISKVVRNIIFEYLEQNKEKIKEYRSKLVNK